MSINDWRSNARPPQFETLEQRIEREAHEERRRAFAANVTGPRHATTVDPQAAAVAKRGEMTPEQRGELAAYHEHEIRGCLRAISHAVTDKERARWTEHLRTHESALVALGPEAERDRRVGAAVMAWECVSCGNTFAPRQFPNSCGYCLRTLRDAVAAALREEAGR